MHISMSNSTQKFCFEDLSYICFLISKEYILQLGNCYENLSQVLSRKYCLGISLTIFFSKDADIMQAFTFRLSSGQSVRNVLIYSPCSKPIVKVKMQMNISVSLRCPYNPGQLNSQIFVGEFIPYANYFIQDFEAENTKGVTLKTGRKWIQLDS